MGHEYLDNPTNIAPGKNENHPIIIPVKGKKVT